MKSFEIIWSGWKWIQEVIEDKKWRMSTQPGYQDTSGSISWSEVSECEGGGQILVDWGIKE